MNTDSIKLYYDKAFDGADEEVCDTAINIFSKIIEKNKLELEYGTYLFYNDNYKYVCIGINDDVNSFDINESFGFRETFEEESFDEKNINLDEFIYQKFYDRYAETDVEEIMHNIRYQSGNEKKPYDELIKSNKRKNSLKESFDLIIGIGVFGFIAYIIYGFIAGDFKVQHNLFTFILFYFILLNPFFWITLLGVFLFGRKQKY